MAALVDFLRSLQSWLIAPFLICLYIISLAVYRLYLSPLAKFPGPKLAALTYGVEFYHDVIRRGQYTFEIIKMHEKYGPIVRITPDELHINDPAYSDELYPGGHKPTEKAPFVAGGFGNSQSVISTVPHNLHRMRRSALSSLFSKRSVTQYAGSIQSCVDQLCARFAEFQTSQKPVDVQVAFAALTADVISLYSFGRSYNCLGKPNFDRELRDGTRSGGELRHLLKHYPWIFNVMMMLPYSITARLNRNAMDMINRRNEIEVHVQALVSGDRKDFKQAGHPSSIFEELLDSDIPVEEKSVIRLVDEGITLIGAGTISTAHVLSTITYHVLANPEILRTLQQELQEAMPDGLDVSAQTRLVRFERLPYLTATITEGLRLADAVFTRNQRVAPDRSLKFHDWIIPPGTIAGMTSHMVHMNPALYPAPREFRPERWLQSDTGSTTTEPGSAKRSFMAFGKGSRMCMGMNLAYAELYLTLAAVFGRFELRLFETTRADVDVAHDFVVAVPKLDTKGVRVMVHERS